MNDFLLIGIAATFAAASHAALVLVTLAIMKAFDRRNYIKRCRTKASQLDKHHDCLIK
jgi:uncharacterized membrane protein YphA (DoxX/SURF4 family)